VGDRWLLGRDGVFLFDRIGRIAGPRLGGGAGVPETSANDNTMF